MNIDVAFVGPSFKPTIVSNCDITFKGNEVILGDNTGGRPFAQSCLFASVATDFADIYSSVSKTSSFRLISLCTSFSVPDVGAILEECQRFAEHRFPAGKSEKLKAPLLLSLGFVHENDVDDFLSIEDCRASTLEQIETYHFTELTDLIEVGLDQLRRIKESVFVLRIEGSSFFEWIIVPRVDSFFPSPSIIGLPANHKFLFVIKALSSMPPIIAQRYARQSRIFSMISDSFSVTQTFWAFHFANEVTFKSNASLLTIHSWLTGTKTQKIAAIPVQIFSLRVKEAPSISDYSHSSCVTEEGRQDLEYLEKIIPNLEEESEGTEREDKEIVLPLDEEEDLGEEVIPKSEGKMSSLSGSSTEFLFQETEEDEEEESSQISPLKRKQANEEEENEYLSLLRNRRKKKRSRRKVLEEKTETYITERAEGGTTPEQEEMQKLRSITARFREAKLAREASKRKNIRQDSSKPSLSIIASSSSFDRVARERAILAKLQQRRKARLEKEEEEEESEDEQEELKKYERKLNMFRIREARFQKMNVLAKKGQDTAARGSIAQIQAVEKEVSEALEKAKEFRDEMKDELPFLRATLTEKRREHEANQLDFREMRAVYLEKHLRNQEAIRETQRRDTLRKTDSQTVLHKREVKKNAMSEFEMAIKFLEKKVRTVREEIGRLRIRVGEMVV
jgi:hypothetical protein